MYSKKEQFIILCVINGLVLVGALAYPLYLALVDALPQMTCAAVRLGFYCPACGGTRALGALLRLDLVSACKYNLLVPLGAITFLVYDVAAIRALVRGKPRESFLSRHAVLIGVAVLIVYTLLRNLLLLWGFDPLGDLLR